MIIGIDASNIGSGGGVAHLKGVVNRATCEDVEILQIVIWARGEILAQIPDHKRIRKILLPEATRSVVSRMRWQLHRLGNEAFVQGCNVLLVPGGIYWGKFRPYIVVVQNMQVFEWSELKREGLTIVTLRLLILLALQGVTLLRATGVVFLSQYCSKYFQKNWPWLVEGKATAVIPHGVGHQKQKRPQKPIESYSARRPFRIVYVSTVRNYKHPWNLVEAVGALYELGYPISLHLVGGGERSALRKLRHSISKYQNSNSFVHYHGHKDHKSTMKCLESADLFAFASSCESFGLSLLEAMSYGLPVACSNRGPLPELLGDAGAYFDPLNSDSIMAVLKSLINDHKTRSKLSTAAWERSKLYTWDNCAKKTLGFACDVSKVAKA